MLSSQPVSSQPVDNISVTANPASCKIQTICFTWARLVLEIARPCSSLGAAGSVRPLQNGELGDQLRRVLMHVPPPAAVW